MYCVRAGSPNGTSCSSAGREGVRGREGGRGGRGTEGGREGDWVERERERDVRQGLRHILIEPSILPPLSWLWNLLWPVPSLADPARPADRDKHA
jgi:hypothetical protein